MCLIWRCYIQFEQGDWEGGGVSMKVKWGNKMKLFIAGICLQVGKIQSSVYWPVIIFNVNLM